MAERLQKAEKRAAARKINCRADPINPWKDEGWIVDKHQMRDPFKWDASMVKLYLAQGQKGESCMNGDKLYELLEDKPVLNANVLLHLYDHQQLIPVSWRVAQHGYGRRIYFWGTLYRRSVNGERCVLGLGWNGGRWIMNGSLLGGLWDNRAPAVVFAA